MKDLIFSPFFFISVSLLIMIMNDLDTKCSGFTGDEGIDWNPDNTSQSNSTIWTNLDDFKSVQSSQSNSLNYIIDDELSWNQYVMENPFQQNEQGLGVFKIMDELPSISEPAHSSSQSDSPTFKLIHHDGWIQSEEEQKFSSSGLEWPQLLAIRTEKPKLNKICHIFSLGLTEQQNHIICTKYQVFDTTKRMRVSFKDPDRVPEYGRVMLSCSCGIRYKNIKLYFFVAHHNDTSYFLLKLLPREVQSVSLIGYVENINVPY